jgi:hypothetical protein
MSHVADINLESYANETDVRVVGPRLIDGEEYSDALKFSNCNAVHVENVEIIGGREDCIDINRGGLIAIADTLLYPRGKFAVTIKGGAEVVTLRNVTLAGHGSEVDIDLGNWSDQSGERTRGVTLDNVFAADGKPVVIRVLHADMPLIRGGNVRVIDRRWLAWAYRTLKRWHLFGCLMILTALAGCASKPGVITTAKGAIVTPENASAPSAIATATATESTAIPKGSTITVTETPATAQAPAQKVTAYNFAEAATQTRVEESTRAEVAPPRAPDQTVALRKADNAARTPLLYAAIGAGAIALGFMVMKWPTAAAASGGASVVFFIAWQAAGLPAWFYMVGILLLVAGACVVLGYKRAEWDANGDGIPDILQQKKK